MASLGTRIIARLCEAQNHRCAYCGVRFGADIGQGHRRTSRWSPPWTRATVEHFVPRSRGGSDDWENLVAACLRCNQLRDVEDALEFFERRGWIRNSWDRQQWANGRLALYIRERT